MTGTSPLCGGAEALVSCATDCRGGSWAPLAALMSWASCNACKPDLNPMRRRGQEKSALFCTCYTMHLSCPDCLNILLA